MNQKHLVGDIVLNWCRIAKGKPTMVFCSGVAHSISV